MRVLLAKLNEINCANTKVASLEPLKNMLYLSRVYCDNSLVTKDVADAFMREKSNVLVISETKALEIWWEELPSFWKTLLSSQNNTSVRPTKEELHSIINMKSYPMRFSIWAKANGTMN